MIALWRNEFEAASYTAEELTSATRFLVNEQPAYRTEHLRLIRKSIREKRGDKQRLLEESSELTGGPLDCDLCRNSGYVEVPHLRYVADGMWNDPWPTCAVLCRCSRGERIDRKVQLALLEHPEKRDKVRVPMKLVDYEMRVPHWWQLMARQQRHRTAQFNSQMAAEAGDRTSGTVSIITALDEAQARLKLTWGMGEREPGEEG